jgi:hypothetical protein
VHLLIRDIHTMPTLPAKGLDRFIDTLTWSKALSLIDKTRKPPAQVTFLHYMQRHHLSQRKTAILALGSLSANVSEGGAGRRHRIL